MKDKLKRQLRAVLAGETSLLQNADACHVAVEQIEHQIRKQIEKREFFNEQDPLLNIAMASYMIGRKDQFFASMKDLFGKEELESAYNQVCIELGIAPKRVN